MIIYSTKKRRWHFVVFPGRTVIEDRISTRTVVLNCFNSGAQYTEAVLYALRSFDNDEKKIDECATALRHYFAL